MSEARERAAAAFDRMAVELAKDPHGDGVAHSARVWAAGLRTGAESFWDRPAHALLADDGTRPAVELLQDLVAHWDDEKRTYSGITDDRVMPEARRLGHAAAALDKRIRDFIAHEPTELPTHLELYGISGTTDALADGITGEAQWLVNLAGRLLRDAADVLRREEESRG